jgi:hypothetical protein
MDTFNDATRRRARRQWETPALKAVGTISEVVKAGGGKLSIAAEDSGDDPRKPKGTG